MHPATGLLSEYWAFARLQWFCPNTGLSPKSPNPIFCFHYAGVPSQSGYGQMKLVQSVLTRVGALLHRLLIGPVLWTAHSLMKPVPRAHAHETDLMSICYRAGPQATLICYIHSHGALSEFDMYHPS